MTGHKRAFFKDEICHWLSPDNGETLSDDLRDRIETFLRDCAGAADGEMDISFQENGRGYYAHLHELERLRAVSQKDYQEYREKLLTELMEADENDELTHQMKIVYDQLNRE